MEGNIKASMTTDDARKLGFHFTLGVFQFLALAIVLGYVFDLVFVPADDCDRSRFDRCGLKVVTDAKTGKQYLVSSGGGIVERAAP